MLISHTHTHAVMLCLEVWRERIVVGRRVEGNDYPLSYLDGFKIKGESKGKFGNSFGQIFLYSTHPPNLSNLGELKMRG